MRVLEVGPGAQKQAGNGPATEPDLFVGKHLAALDPGSLAKMLVPEFPRVVALTHPAP